MESEEAFVNMRPGRSSVPVADKITRQLHHVLPLSTQNSWRDRGWIRSMFNTATTLGYGALGLVMPHATARMVALRASMRLEHYGDKTEVLEIYDGPSTSVSACPHSSGAILTFVLNWNRGLSLCLSMVEPGVQDFLGCIRCCAMDFLKLFNPARW